MQGNANTGTFMFEIMQRDVIRVFVYVPQDAAFGVAPGVDAIVRVPEIPNREFPGKVTRIADALQSGTRTLLTEIDIPNPDDALPPGNRSHPPPAVQAVAFAGIMGSVRFARAAAMIEQA